MAEKIDNYVEKTSQLTQKNNPDKHQTLLDSKFGLKDLLGEIDVSGAVSAKDLFLCGEFAKQNEDEICNYFNSNLPNISDNFQNTQVV